MPIQVVSTAVLQCSFGAAPGTLTVLPVGMVTCSNLPAANIMDHIPLVNIAPFGVCMSPSNPMVAAATAAAMGVLTPMPCIPVTVTPWTPGAAKTLVATMPALHDGCMCNCMWGGVIKVVSPGQMTHEVN
ncbi:MAG: DUF4280 domain-containing protein [Opitutus sp.]